MAEEVKHTADEMWALRVTADAAEVWTENGRLVAQFRRREDAEEVIDDHNLEVEFNEPDPPEVQKSNEQKQAERLAHYRQADPKGTQLIALTIEGLQRLERLLSLSAPRIIVSEQIKTVRMRVDTLDGLFPYEEDAIEKAEAR